MRENVTTAATTTTQKTTFRPLGWLILAKITVTMNGLQSDSHPGGLNASRDPEPRSPPKACKGPKEHAAGPLTVTRWNVPCGRPSAESGPAASRCPRPGRGAPAGPRAAARGRTCAERTCAGRGQVRWRPRPARPSSCFGLPPPAVIELVSSPPQVRGRSARRGERRVRGSPAPPCCATGGGRALAS